MIVREGDGDRSRLAIPALFLAGFLVYCSNHTTMVYVPLMVLQEGGTVLEAGAQASVYLVAAILLRLFLGPWADRGGMRRALVLGAGAFAIALPFLGLTNGFVSLLVVRCVQAVGMALFFPCAMAALATICPPERSGTVLGLYRLVSSVALMVAAPAAFCVIEGWGFSACFGLTGFLSLLALLLVLLVLPSESSKGRGRIPSQQEDVGQEAADAKEAFFGLGRGTTALIVLVSLVAALVYGLVTNFGTVLVDQELPGTNAGLLLSLVGLGGLVANPIVGTVSDRGYVSLALIVCLLSLGVGLVGATLLCKGPLLLVASGLLVGVGYYGAIMGTVVLAAKGSPHRRATIMSLQQSCVDAGIGSSGLVFGVLSTALPLIAVFAGAGIFVCGGGAAVALSRYRLRRFD